jgi:hypothetical protein
MNVREVEDKDIFFLSMIKKRPRVMKEGVVPTPLATLFLV